MEWDCIGSKLQAQVTEVVYTIITNSQIVLAIPFLEQEHVQSPFDYF